MLTKTRLSEKNMRGVNKVILVGAVGKDPEIKTFNDGSAIAQLSLATTETWKDKISNETKELTEWHRLVFYKPLADVVKQYVKKGSKLYIEGSLRTRQWTDQAGITKYTTEIRVQNMQMLDTISKNQPQSSSAIVQPPVIAAESKNKATNTYMSDEDEIPF